MEPVDMLTKFGLTHQEASLYLCLCSQGCMTGYEAAKISGISRSNTYNALAGLVEKGAAYVMEDTASHYTPVPPEEFCGNYIRRLQECRRMIVGALPERCEDKEGYITIKGENNIIDKMKNLIDEARERIYLALSAKTISLVEPQLADAAARGLKVIIITEPPAEIAGAQIYYSATSPWQIRLITDSKNVLTGDIAYGQESTCLYSKKRNLVDLFKEALKNEITLIKLTKGVN